MCGRSTCKPTWEEIVALYRLTLEQPKCHGAYGMRTPSLLTIFVSALLALPAAAEGPVPDRLQRILDSGTLRVGTTMDTPVFSMRNSAGQLEGFDKMPWRRLVRRSASRLIT